MSSHVLIRVKLCHPVARPRELRLGGKTPPDAFPEITPCLSGSEDVCTAIPC